VQKHVMEGNIKLVGPVDGKRVTKFNTKNFFLATFVESYIPAGLL